MPARRRLARTSASVLPQRSGDPRCREAHRGPPQHVGVGERRGADLALELDDLPDVLEEPRVDGREAVDLLGGHPATVALRHSEAALDVGHADLLAQRLVVSGRRVHHEPPAVLLERADGFLERLLEGSPDGHAVGSVVALGGMVVAVLMKSGVPPFLAGCLTVLTGAVLGLGMGSITAYAKVPSFIIALAGLVRIRGVTYLISQGTPLWGFPPEFKRPRFAVGGRFCGHVVCVFGVALIAFYILQYTVLGEYMYATCGNIQAARLRTGAQYHHLGLPHFGSPGGAGGRPPHLSLAHRPTDGGAGSGA